ncbi:MAG: TonB-dependent receptor [Verrucomicrobiota bacterium]
MNLRFTPAAIWLRVLLLLPWLSLVCFGQAPATGTIEGRVFNETSGSYLNNARVSIEGSSRETLTDQYGFFRLSEVPAGAAKVRVFYTGLPTQETVVTVTAGGRAEQNFSLGNETRAEGRGTVKLNAFIVESTRDMTSASIAINEQRFARTIKSVLSTDTFGDIADGNVADFAKFLPGVTADGNAGISVGGVPYHATPIMVDGHLLASAAGRVESRQVDLQQISINNMSRLEITRGQNPDSPAAAIGGSVNLVPKSAFEYARPSYVVKGYASFTDQSFKGYNIYKINPNFEVSATVPVTKNFGFSLNVSRLVNDSGTQGIATSWVPTVQVVNANYPAPPAGQSYLGLFEYYAYPREYTRPTVGFTLDWRFARYDVLSLGFQYSDFVEDVSMRDRFIFNIGRVASYGDGFTQGAAGAGFVQANHDWSDKGGRTYMPTVKWRHRGTIWEWEARGAYSNATSRTYDVDRGTFQNGNSYLRNVTVRFDDVGYYGPQKITVTNALGQPVDPYRIANYNLESNAASITAVKDEKRSFQTYIARHFTVGIPLRTKLGFDATAQTRDHTRAVLNYNYFGADGRAQTADDNAAQWLDSSYLERGSGWAPVPREGVSGDMVWATFQANPSYFNRPEATVAANHRTNVNAGKRITEAIYAPYLRFDASRLLDGKLNLTGGFRYERTDTHGVGPLINPSLIYQRDANGNIVRNAAGTPIAIATLASLQGTQLAYVMRGAEADRTYGRLFPSLNLSYNLRENLIARFSYAKSIARPDFELILPGATVPDETTATRLITLRNPALKPWIADSFGVSLEYYFNQPSDGVVSARWFVREIEDFWGTQTGPITPELLDYYGLDPAIYGADRGYTVSTSYNVGAARIMGTEFEYRQNLNFLPAWARGFNIFANVTLQKLSSNPEANFEGFIKKTINYGVAYSRQRFTLRLNVNMRGREQRDLFVGAGTEPGTYNYRAPATFLDGNIEYRLTKHIALYGTARNLLNDLRPDERYGPSTPGYAKLRTLGDMQRQFTAGVRGTF